MPNQKKKTSETPTMSAVPVTGQAYVSAEIAAQREHAAAMAASAVTQKHAEEQAAAARLQAQGINPNAQFGANDMGARTYTPQVTTDTKTPPKPQIKGTYSPPPSKQSPSGGVTKPGAPGSTTSGVVSSAAAFNAFKANYPEEAAVIASDPSLTKLFADAMHNPKGAMAPAKFQQLYEQSAYYQNHSDSYRNAEQSRLAGRGEYDSTYNTALDNIKKYAIEAGITIDPQILGDHIAPPADPNAPQAAHVYDPSNPSLVDDVLHKWWDTGSSNQTLITQYLAAKGKIDPTLVGGAAQTNIESLKNYANDLGLNSLVLKGGNDYFNNAATGIATGKSDLNFWHDDLINQAKALYPIYAKQLDAGGTIRGMGAGYLNTYSNLMDGLPTDQIDLSSDTGPGALIRKAMQGDGTNPIPMADFAAQVRTDPAWAKTLNAQGTVDSMVHQIGRDWGVAS